jgi:glycosyltransferase involved in cell wall biosynthesis
MVLKALQLFFIHKHRFDVIISNNHLITGIQAAFIGKIINAKVVVEVNGNFEAAFKYGATGMFKPGLIDKIKDRVSIGCISWVAQHVDAVKLVYSNQLIPLKLRHAQPIKTYCFPNFVPIKYFLDNEKTDGKYLLLMGYPWYLKGVDVLIKAFNIISSDFPDYTLKIVGWIPKGKEYYENLINGNDKIELLDPVFYDKVITYMTNCSLYVLASRTDSSPRVLREAMASKKPIIASNIDGVPDLIKDGYNGLLFKSENHADLADKISLILSDNNLANQLAENGFNYVQKYLSEECYITKYKAMIDDLFNKSRPD